MTSRSERAKDAREHFQARERDNGETFVSLDELSPAWLREAVREAHGDLLPDDWRYECVADAFERIAEADGDDLDDVAAEFADGVDVYTSDLLAWLASHLSRPSYCDEAMRELGGGVDDTVRLVMLGQSYERREVFDSVVRSLEASDK